MITLSRFTVLVDNEDPESPGDEHTVTVRHGDQLRAELEGPKHGLTSIEAAPMHYMTLWVWAALTREGKTTVNFQTFKGQILGLEPVEAGEDVDPTTPGADTA